MARVRSVLPVAVLGLCAAVGGGLWWHLTAKDRLIAEQKRIIEALERKLDRSWASEIVAPPKYCSVA